MEKEKRKINRDENGQGKLCWVLVLLFLSSYLSKENKKKILPNLGTKIEEKYRHIYQDTAVPVFIKARK